MSEKTIWEYLKAQGLTDAGVAGLMGNLYAESGLRPNNLQNSYEGKLGMADAEYTEMVDRGTYANFGNDRAGYGLAQWTYPSRKAALLAYAKAAGKSIGDLEMQLGFLMQELSAGYKTVLNILRTTVSVREASDIVLLQFERPADQSEARQKQRAEYGQKYFDKYAKKGDGIMGFTNSSLATVRMISPNRTPNRNHVIDTITIHCFVGQVTAKRGCEVFQPSSRKASCKLTTIAQLKKQALMSKADSAARVAELAELMAASLEDSQIGFTVTLPAANWNGRVQTVKHKSLLADSSYWYLVCGDAECFMDCCDTGVKADNVTVNGEITFRCEVTPDVDLTVNILRLEVIEKNE